MDTSSVAALAGVIGALIATGGSVYTARKAATNQRVDGLEKRLTDCEAKCEIMRVQRDDCRAQLERSRTDVEDGERRRFRLLDELNKCNERVNRLDQKNT